MPPRRRGPVEPTPVDALTHDDKRVNIPTADQVDSYGEPGDVETVVWGRDPTLDPQLVWRGKSNDTLVTDAPPIYQQEKIDPRVLIENLRKNPADQLDLFADFDGLDELSQLEFYRHQANWSNRMILGDSLQVMASLSAREQLRGQVQMVYIDPPYGIKFGSNWQSRVGNRSVGDKVSDVAREAEQIKAFRDTWELGIHSYLSYLRDRLIAARELLTESGSCFVQIGDENVHLVRSLMDEVFGRENFCGLITYKTTTGAGSPAVTTEVLAGVSDHVIWYARERDRLAYRTLYFERRIGDDPNYRLILENDVIRPLSANESRNVESLYLGGAKICRQNPITSQTGGPTTTFPVNFNGHTFRPSRGGWKTNAAGMAKLKTADRLISSGSTLGFARFFSDFPFQTYANSWDDTRQSGFGDPKIYVVQTSTKVIERCMLMCTDPGDLVVDPTCGSGTTAFVAEQWGRRWITIDTSRVALTLARQRLMGARYPYYKMVDPSDIRQGFDYEKVQHITLKSIANNPDIREGMSRDEIDAAIKRHADFETLYDRPYEDRSRVRVTGPFTVESLSPHRSLAFAASHTDETQSETAAAKDPDGPTFEQSILDNLRAAGIQNGRRGERIDFAALDSYAGSYVQAVGEQTEVADAAPSRVGIAIGPQYGTVSPSFIKSAAKEAIAADDIDLLCVLGFAFDAQASEVTEVDGVNISATDQGFASVAGERRLGRLKVLLVRMNVDLLMGEELKKTGAGNLFTVFGEPDIEIRKANDQLVVTVRGVDVYDPTTGEVRSEDTAQIALWMIDTNYNDEAFFVRHCYFTGANDPYKRLKTALKADIDPDAWASLYRTESRSFDVPETGRIAVKVINDYGDEVMKVFEV